MSASPAQVVQQVTRSEDVAKVQHYLTQYFPASIKLFCSIRSWQQQLAAGVSAEPTCPSLYIGVPTCDDSKPAADPFSSLNVVVLMYGDGATPEGMSAKQKEIDAIPAELRGKIGRKHMDIYVSFFAQDGSDVLLEEALNACLPKSLPFYFFGTPSSFNHVIEKLALENTTYISHLPHHQWNRSKDDAQNRHSIASPTAASPVSHSASPVSSASSPSPSPSSSESNVSSHSSSSSLSSPVIIVAPLRPEHVEMVVTHWPYSSPSTRRVVSYLIPNLPNRCVYVDGVPVSWVLIQTYGGLGMLHTMDEHRGKGYARMCVDSLCEELQSRGELPFCYIGVKNIASRKVFQAMQFTQAHACDWIQWVPPVYDPTKPPE